MKSEKKSYVVGVACIALALSLLMILMLHPIHAVADDVYSMAIFSGSTNITNNLC